ESRTLSGRESFWDGKSEVVCETRARVDAVKIRKNASNLIFMASQGSRVFMSSAFADAARFTASRLGAQDLQAEVAERRSRRAPIAVAVSSAPTGIFSARGKENSPAIYRWGSAGDLLLSPARDGRIQRRFILSSLRAWRHFPPIVPS